MTENTSSIFINKYLFINNQESPESKKIYKNFKKNNLQNCLINKQYRNNFETKSIRILLDYLNEFKKSMKYNKNYPNYIGVVTDKVTINQNLCIIPQPPNESDILCLQSDISSYDFSDSENDKFWTRTKISDSMNFIINIKSLNIIINNLKESSNWDEFILKLNNLKIYSIIPNVMSSLNQYKLTLDDKNGSFYDNFAKQLSSIPTTNYRNLVNQFNSKYESLSIDKRAALYPNISLVCIPTDKDSFVDLMCSFLKLDYPKDRLELIVVDDLNLNKELSGIIPEDKRIKMLNLNKSDVPLGYKLNMAIKYASYDLIFNCFSSNLYFSKNFTELIRCFIISGKDILLSRDTGYIKTVENNKKGYVSKVCDLANMIYTKKIWKVLEYENEENDQLRLIYKFIITRSNCANFIPFLYFSLKKQDPVDFEVLQELPFDIDDLILRDSF